MRPILSLLISALLVGVMFGTPPLHAQRAALPFVAAWAGEWAGTLTVYGRGDSVLSTVPLTLAIAPEPTGGGWTWRTVYNADTVRGLRPYRLLPDTGGPDRWLLDENNGIQLAARHVGGVLFTVFDVDGRHFLGRDELRGDTLVLDLIFWRAAARTITRGTGANAEGGMPVGTTPLEGRQRAVLTRRRRP
jgi:hypothetical protein